jgi:hypothetical protein
MQRNTSQPLQACFSYSIEELIGQSPIAVVPRVEMQTRLRWKTISARPSTQARTTVHTARAPSAATRTLHLDTIRKTGVDKASMERKRGYASSPLSLHPMNGSFFDCSPRCGPFIHRPATFFRDLRIRSNLFSDRGCRNSIHFEDLPFF